LAGYFWLVAFRNFPGFQNPGGLHQTPMKSLYLIALSIVLASCAKDKKTTAEPITYESEAQTPIAHGKELFDGAGNCFACHKEDQKIIAPSLVEIAKIYKDQNADMVEFLKGTGKPIVDPSQYETMKTNFAITKNMTEEELKALEAYVMSFAK
jgi:cytochrome c